MEIKIYNNIKPQLCKMLSPEWNIIYEIIQYFTEQGFCYERHPMFSAANPCVATRIDHILIFANNLINISIDDLTFNIKLNIGTNIHILKVNDDSLGELIKIIEDYIGEKYDGR